MIAALALAIAGDTARAESMAQDLGRSFPLDTQMQSLWLPALLTKGIDPNSIEEATWRVGWLRRQSYRRWRRDRVVVQSLLRGRWQQLRQLSISTPLLFPSPAHLPIHALRFCELHARLFAQRFPVLR